MMKSCLCIFFSVFATLNTFAKSDLKIFEDEIFLRITQSNTHLNYHSLPDPEKNFIVGEDFLSLDLVLHDLLDQIYQVLSVQKFKPFRDSFFKTVGNDPVKNFKLWKERLVLKAETEKEIRNKLNKVRVRKYYGRFIQGQDIRNPRNFKLKQFQAKSHERRYSQILHHPEGENLVRWFEEYLEDDSDYRFYSSKLTVPRFKLIKKRDVSRMVEKYNLLYASHWKKVIATELIAQSIDFKFSTNKKFPLMLNLSKSDKKYRNGAFLLYNNILKLTYKLPLLSTMRDHFQEKMSIHQLSDRVRNIYFTPLFVVENYDLVKKLTKEFIYSKQVERGNDDLMMPLRKWVKSNREQVELRIGKKLSHRKNRLPLRTEIMDLYPTLEHVFPDRPWLEGVFTVDEKGRPLYLERTQVGRLLRKTGRWFRNQAKIENIIANGIGALGLFTSFNPYVAALLHTASTQIVTGIKYGYTFKEKVKETPRKLLASMVLASGVAPGRLPHRIMYGGVTGLVHAGLTGQPADISIIVGGILEGLIAQLPSGYRKLVVSGMDKNFENAILEFVENSLKGGVRGFTVALFDDQDVIDGAKKGAVAGSVESALKIALIGFRYRADELVADEYMTVYGETEHNPVVADRAYGGEWLYLDRSQIGDINFRKDNAFMRLLQGGGPTSTSWQVFSESYISDTAQSSEKIITHEGYHYVQEMHHGAFNYFFRYLRSIAKYGGSIYEDYFVCTCPIR